MQSALERFNAKVLKTDTCWLWQGTKAKGYGRLNIDGKRVYAHRFSYSVSKGILEPSQVIMHTCDNPSCVNPDHLVQGTQKDNVLDMINKGRQTHGRYNAAKTHCSKGHEYTEDTVYVLPSRPNVRYCKVCKNDAAINAQRKKHNVSG